MHNSIVYSLDKKKPPAFQPMVMKQIYFLKLSYSHPTAFAISPNSFKG